MRIITQKPVALDSFDHIEPLGAKDDNTVRPEFNAALFELFDKTQLNVLDIGCSGGGFVESLLKDGCRCAVGVEGSDAPFKSQRAAWATIPNNLFNADVTEEFRIEDDNGKRIGFNLITAWEFMEHISISDLDEVFCNVSKHLVESGLFIGSISTIPCENERGKYHQTIKPEWWWRDFFRNQGFHFDDALIHFFEGKWLRSEVDGHGHTSFGFVARRL